MQESTAETAVLQKIPVHLKTLLLENSCAFLLLKDCLWMPKCVRFGWFLPYTPADKEYGAWKHHYLACVADLDWLTPREAAAVHGTLREPNTEAEELPERQREKCLRKIIWEKTALRKSEQRLTIVSYPRTEGLGAVLLEQRVETR